jgi:hypothetical protein
MTPNPSIERTSQRPLRALCAAAHVNVRRQTSDMGIFSRSASPAKVDPVFGRLTQSKLAWQGEVPSPTGQSNVLLSVERGAEGPTAEDRAAYSAFVDNYPALRSELRDGLFELWRPGIGDALWEEQWPTTAEALWAMIELSSLCIQPGGKLELLYAFGGDVWPDAMFTLRVEGKQVIPVALDD